MDIPLAQNYRGIRNGFKGYRRKSSTFNRKAGVEELSALFVNGCYFLDKMLVTSSNDASLKDKDLN